MVTLTYSGLFLVSFLDSLNDWVNWLSGIVWGLPLMVMLIGTGLLYTFLLGFLQIRYLWLGLKIAFGYSPPDEDKNSPKTEGDISPFQALSTALSATVGTGNIVGVAGAILVGGPGAVFWMWCTAILGMVTKYAEALLAVRYREKTKHGFAGGPMYYLSRGLGMPWLGSLFAVFTLLAAFGIGNLTQINSSAGALAVVGVPREVTSFVAAALIGLVVIGGVKRIGRVASIVVPFMALFYFIFSIWFLSANTNFIPIAFASIFHYAFEPLPAVSGTLMGLFMITIRNGVARGLFSNEAGLGTSPIAAASARVNYAAKQGLVAMIGPFLDTIIICTITALVILTGIEKFGVSILNELAIGSGQTWQLTGNDVWASISAMGSQVGEVRAQLVSAVWKTEFGNLGPLLVSAGLFFFSVSTILGFYYYSDRAMIFLGWGKFVRVYQVFYISLIIVGGLIPKVDLIWGVTDLANGLMALPNLVGLVFLSPVVYRETKTFFNKFPHRHDLGVQIYMLLIRVLPKNILSKFMGMLARIPLPRFMMIGIILAYARIFKVDIREAELELKDYSSLNEFFSRSLKDGSRLIESGTDTIISPVDGTLLKFGPIEEDTQIQSKGLNSSLKEVLGPEADFGRFVGGNYITIYLSPRDYHHVHAPLSGEIIGYDYLPGKLFPVNQVAMLTINRLFSRNERLISYIRNEKGLMALVKIGATSVGKIKVNYDDSLTTNSWFRKRKSHRYESPTHIEKGDDLARFEMGSTVMLLFEKGVMEFLELEEKMKLKLGQPIGIFKAKKT